MATVERENIGLLNDKLTVKIKKEDYLPSFEKKLKEVLQNSQYSRVQERNGTCRNDQKNVWCFYFF